MLDQLILFGIVAGCIYTLVAISFAIIYQITRFFHFAHAAVFTLGPYLTYLFKVWLDIPIFLSIPMSIIGCSLIGCLMELLVYRSLRIKNASPMVLLLASLGIYIVLQNIISLVFGDGAKSIRSGIIQEGINILNARITPIQIIIIFTSIVLVIVVSLFLYKTRMGKAMRAVANDPELAKILGVNADKIILWTFAIGSALAGVAGILVAFDVDMNPVMGMNALMMGVVAVIIGGVNSSLGVILGSLFLALAQHLSIWKISSQWQDSIAFMLLIFFLIFRPQGFLGKKIRKVSP